MYEIIFTGLPALASNLTWDPSSNPLFTPGIISKQAASIFLPLEEMLLGRKRQLRLISSKARIMIADELEIGLQE